MTTGTPTTRPIAFLNRHPLLIGGVCLLIIAVAMYFSAFRSSRTRQLAYFTTDGGRTFFAADAWDPAPATISGREADYAFVYSADGGNTLFVGYVMRYTSEGKAKAIKMRDAGNWGPIDEIEVKRPGDNAWVRKPTLEEAARLHAQGQPVEFDLITDVKSPDRQSSARLMQPPQ